MVKNSNLQTRPQNSEKSYFPFIFNSSVDGKIVSTAGIEYRAYDVTQDATESKIGMKIAKSKKYFVNL
jgi:hypothetical protein